LRSGGANIFQILANKTGYRNAQVDTGNLYFNMSYPGPLSNAAYAPNWPDPITNSSCAAGNGVLDAVKKAYSKSSSSTLNYTNAYPYDAVSKNNNGGTPVMSSNLTSSGPAAAASSKKAAAPLSSPGVFLGLVGLLAGILFGV
jgi:acid phosphatase